MPFTLSHPLAVVPFARTALPLSALVIGSMSPDFEYLLRLRQDSHASHSPLGVLGFCLPASWLVLWLWHGWLKRPLLELLSDRHRARLLPHAGEFRFGPASRAGTISIAILVGAITHVLWDSFTHGWGWPVRHLALLQAEIAFPGFEPLPLYRRLQHASSLLGLLALMVIYCRWSRHQEPISIPTGLIPRRSRTLIAAIGLLIATTLGTTFAAMQFPPTEAANLKAFVVRSAVVTMSASFLLSLGYSIWFRYHFPERD